MLIEFRVKNFGCLREEQALSFVPASNDPSLLKSNTFETGVPSVPRLLRTAVIYGPNAGGKSTVLRAFQTMRDLVVASSFIETKGKFPVPFLLDTVSREEPTAFEASFLHEGHFYQYGFSCLKGRITEEYLFEYRTSRRTRLFERCFDRESDRDVYSFGKSLRGPKNVWRTATQGSVLFLPRAVQLNSEQLRPLWEGNFPRYLVFNRLVRPPINVFLKQIRDIASLKANICSFLRSGDMDIRDIEIQENLFVPESDKDRYSLSFIHETAHGDVALPTSAESDGTMRLLYYLVPLLQALELGGVVAIDELDTSLHPLLVRRIVEVFQSPRNNPARSGNPLQLVFTTHDTSLLLDMETVFRRDQIWFVEKDADQASRLFSLAEFKTEDGLNHSLAYLHGLYGALPLLRNWEEK